MNEQYFQFERVTEDQVLRATFFSNCRLAESGCWLWTGAKTDGGYGTMGRKWLAHRLSHYLFKGPIPKGLHVLHSCDTPACVNPAHLRAGTRKENMADCVARGRFRKSTGSFNNLAKLTDADVVDIRNSTLSAKVLSKKYGIDRTNVHQIVTGKTWQHVSMPETPVEKLDGRAKLTHEQVRAIKSADSSVNHRQLATQHGVGVSLISMIRNGRIWKRVIASTQENVDGR